MRDTFKVIRIAGLISIIPLALVSGPIAGYFAGEYLHRHFFANEYTTTVCAVIGLLAGLAETFRIIRIVVKLEKS